MQVKGAIIALALVTVTAACSDGLDDGGWSVVVTTNILGDVVANVVGDEATVEVLMPIGADPHEFQASSAQVAKLVNADLVVANGLALEEGLTDVLAAIAADGVHVLEVAPLLDPVEFAFEDDEEEHEHGLDPHVWMDPLRMARAAILIGEAMADLAPNGDWLGRSAAYAGELERVDGEIQTLLSAVALSNRELLSNHATFGYFADRYGWRLLPTVIPGGSSTGSPSSEHLAELVDLIRAEDVRAIFVEATQPDAIARALAAEAGGVTVVELHTGSLTDAGGEAPTLIDLLRGNARLIASALGG